MSFDSLPPYASEILSQRGTVVQLKDGLGEGILGPRRDEHARGSFIKQLGAGCHARGHHGNAAGHRFQNGVRHAFAVRRVRNQHVEAMKQGFHSREIAQEMDPIRNLQLVGKAFEALAKGPIASQRQMGVDRLTRV